MIEAYLKQRSPQVSPKVIVQLKFNEGNLVPSGNLSPQLGTHNYEDI